MNKQKSQVTMLMIIGLVLFIIVSLTFYLTRYSIKKQTIQNIKITNEAADTKPIKELVEKCLDKLAKDAVVLLGRQGGYIYKSQGGTLIDYPNDDEGRFFIKYNNLNVAYNIIALPRDFSVDKYSSDIPEYPWHTFPYQTETSNEREKVFDGIFGLSNLPAFDASEGPNSIQTQIESYVDKNIARCADFSAFENIYSIVMNSSKTNVIIGTSDITVKSSIPIKIADISTNKFTELSDFSTNLNVRLRGMYYFAKDLIHNDIKNIQFNINNPRNNKDSFYVSSIKDANQQNNDDLIIITDQNSLIYGKPFEYIFSRKNRAPVLYYIKNKLRFDPGAKIIMESEIFHMLNINQLTDAADPDEDEVTIHLKWPLLPYDVPHDQKLPNFRIEVSDGKLSDFQNIETVLIEHE